MAEAIKKNDMRQALDRADRLINWMSEYIGQMAPGKYSGVYADLNEHGLYMEELKRIERKAGITT